MSVAAGLSSQGQAGPRANEPTNLAETANSRFSERVCLKKDSGEQWRKIVRVHLWPLHVHIWASVNMYTHTKFSVNCLL